MGKRITLGIVFNYDENWIGGTYYFQYLIQSLNLLEDDQKPNIVIVSNQISSFKLIKELNYPYLTYQNSQIKKNLLERLIDKINRILNPKAIIQNKKIDFGIDILFRPSEIIVPNKILKHLFWIPDFQEMYLPNLFSENYLAYRKKTQIALLGPDKHVLFSSQDALKDFKKQYPTAQTNCFVVPFSVFHPDFSSINFENLKAKFKLDSNIEYFFSPNQFWKHKNHIIVLKAIKLLKHNSAKKIIVLFSGKESDHRNPTYFDELKEYIKINELEENVKFLGFIDRKEQLCFMKNAIAIIQPSLFEGWSSVVEDAKSLNKNIIASSLGVHKEQLETNAYFFDPLNEVELSEHLNYFLENKVVDPNYNYKQNLNKFGLDFLNVIRKIV